MNEWKVEGWSYPAEKMIHIIITDGTKRIRKTYSQKGSYLKFMLNHGLLLEAFDIARKVW